MTSGLPDTRPIFKDVTALHRVNHNSRHVHYDASMLDHKSLKKSHKVRNVPIALTSDSIQLCNRTSSASLSPAEYIQSPYPSIYVDRDDKPSYPRTQTKLPSNYKP
jgi:hypothetical protein